MIKPGETDEYTPFKDLTENDWTLSPGETVTFIDDDTIEHEFDEVLPAWLSVPRSIMSERIRKYNPFYTEGGKEPKIKHYKVKDYIECDESLQYLTNLLRINRFKFGFNFYTKEVKPNMYKEGIDEYLGYIMRHNPDNELKRR